MLRQSSTYLKIVLLLRTNFQHMKKIFFSLLGFLLILQLTHAQKPQNSTFLYGVEEGISDRIVNDVKVDELGYVWVCEQRELQMWDGQKFIHLHRSSHMNTSR